LERKFYKTIAARQFKKDAGTQKIARKYTAIFTST
jgi:hypothetical protein